MDSKDSEEHGEGTANAAANGVWPPKPVETASISKQSPQNVIDVPRICRLRNFVALTTGVLIILLAAIAGLQLMQLLFYWHGEVAMMRETYLPNHVIHQAYYIDLVCALIVNSFWLVCSYSNLFLLVGKKQRFVPWLATALAALPAINVFVVYPIANELWLGSQNDPLTFGNVPRRFIKMMFGLAVFGAIYNIASVILFHGMAGHLSQNTFGLYLAFTYIGIAGGVVGAAMVWIAVRAVTAEQIRKGQMVAELAANVR